MLKMSEQQRFETIRRLVRDWVDNNRAAFARQGGEVEDHEGADWDGAAFYTATCLLPHCVARVVVTMPAFHPFRFVGMEALSAETGDCLLNWHDGDGWATDEAIQIALRHLQDILLDG